MKFSLSLLCLFLLLKAALVVFCADFSQLDLGPDEAQYWTWSKNLDWGYYSKPPGIAWLIAAATAIFGDTAWGVRSVALCLGSLLPLLMYRLGNKAGLTEEAAAAAAWILACIPIGFLAILFTTTDAPYIFFWMGALVFLAEALQSSRSPNYLLFGVWIAIGALFKWPIYYLWIIVFLGWGFYPSWRTRQIFVGMIISLLGLLTSLWWNASHGWATFRHVSSTLQGGSVAVAQGNAGDFIAAQSAILFPLLFLMLIPAFYHLWRHRSTAPPAILWLGSISGIVLAIFVILSTKQKMQGNWAIFTVPGFVLLLAWYLVERLSYGKKIIAASLSLSVLCCTFILLIPYLGAAGILPPSYQKINPFRHNLGWHLLGAPLVARGYDPDRHFLFSDTYQNVSELYFYGPKQKRPYFLNLQDRRRNQFSYWPTMEEEQRGKTGYFLWIENSPKWQQQYPATIEKYKKMLAPFFDRVDMVAVEPVGGDEMNSVKGVVIFKCEGYKGFLLEDSKNF